MLLPLSSRTGFRRYGQALCTATLIALLPAAAWAQDQKPKATYMFQGEVQQYPSIIEQSGTIEDGQGTPQPTFTLKCGYRTDPQTQAFIPDPTMNKLVILDLRPGHVSLTSFEQPDGVKLAKIINPSLKGFASIERVTSTGVQAVLVQVFEAEKGAISLGGIIDRNPGSTVLTQEQIETGVRHAESICTQGLKKLGHNSSSDPKRDAEKTKAYKSKIREVLFFFPQ